jgi:hypothetical protein
MTDIQERLRSVQTRRSQAEAQRTRNEVEVENADKALAAAKEALVEEFQIVTSADLKAVREKLESDLEEAIAAVEKQLDAAGA